MDPVRNIGLGGVRLPYVAIFDWQFGYDRPVPFEPYLKCAVRVSAGFYRDTSDPVAVEIFESRRCGVFHIANVSRVFIPIPSVLHDFRKCVPSDIDGIFICKEIACQISIIFPLSVQRAVV